MADQQKTVAVVIPSGQDGTDTALQEIDLLPGSTAQDVLNSLGKGSGYILGTMSGTVFRPKDLLFGQVESGDKLAITPSAEAGASAPDPRPDGWLTRLGRAISGTPIQEDRQSRTPVATPGSVRRATPGRAVSIAPDIRPAWREKGWKEVSPGAYEGWYRSPFGVFRGRVEFARYGFRRMYIWDPPRALWDAGHPKAICFGREGGNRHQVHMRVFPQSVDSAILNVERILHEAYEMLQRRRRHG